MSTQIKGTAVRKVQDAMVTDDGRNILMRLIPFAGQEIVLAFPASEIGTLILLAAQCATGARARRDASEQMKEVFAVDDWEVDVNPQTGAPVLSLRMAGKAELSFVLPAGAQQSLIDKLAATLPAPAPDPSQIN